MDLIKVIKAIKVRPTHSNMIFPGPGIGGYMILDPDEVIKMTGRPVAVIDCFGILDDEKIKRYFELNCEVKGLGRGHVKRIKDQVKAEN